MREKEINVTVLMSCQVMNMSASGFLCESRRNLDDLSSVRFYSPPGYDFENLCDYRRPQLQEE
jgi:hypothetical protein